MNLVGEEVLVTGGAGFIGSHLVDALVRKGANVAVLDDLSTGSKDNLNPKATFYQGSITDVDVVRKSVRAAGLIYHLAADATTRESSMGWDTPARTLDTNIIGTLNVYKSIVDLDLEPKVIYASSAAVYGEPIFTPVKEDHPTNPVSPYGISKLAGEKLALAFLKESGVDSVVVRIFNTYGPRQPRYVIFELMKKLRIDKTRLQVLGTPNIVRDYCYVSDMIDALVLAAERGLSGQIYNVSGGCPVAMLDLVGLILAQLGLVDKVDVQYTGRSWKGDIARMEGDISRIAELGFRPKIPLSEGLKKMVESAWWRSLTSTGRDGFTTGS